jgi:hypothetical protein
VPSDDSASTYARSLEAVCDNDDTGQWCPQPEQILAGMRAMQKSKGTFPDNQDDLKLLARYEDGSEIVELQKMCGKLQIW